MRKPLDRRSLRGSTQWKQQDRAPGFRHFVRHRQWKAAAPAKHGEGAFDTDGGSCAHASASAVLRMTAIVNGRFPARINSMILFTRGSAPYSDATWSMRVRNSPAPKNSA